MNIPNLIRSFFSRTRSTVHIDPVRDWLTMLTLSILAFVSVVMWNVLAFDTVARGGVIGTSTTVAPLIFDRSSLDIVHSVFSKRTIEEAKYVTGVYRYVDPSQ